jgi:hypothetical protein
MVILFVLSPHAFTPPGVTPILHTPSVQRRDTGERGERGAEPGGPRGAADRRKGGREGEEIGIEKT